MLFFLKSSDSLNYIERILRIFSFIRFGKIIHFLIHLLDLLTSSYVLECPLSARFLEFGVLHQKIMVIGMI